MAALVYKDASGKKQRFVLAADSVSVGRHGSNDLVLPDALVSRKHCLFEKRGENYALVDLGSSYGTYVNDDRVEGVRELMLGDHVRVGNIQLKLVLEGEATAGEVVLDGGAEAGDTDSGQPALTIELDDIRRVIFGVMDWAKGLPPESKAPNAEIGEIINRLKLLRLSLVELERNKLLAQTLAEVGKLIHLIRDLDTILSVTLDLAVRALGADRGYILFKEDEKLSIRVTRNMGDMRGISSSIAEQVVANGTTVVTDDATIDPRYNQKESVMMNAIRAVICVPLRAKSNEVFGAIYVDGRPGGNLFDNRAVGFLSGFASHAANAIESARLIAQSAVDEETRQRLSRYFSKAVVDEIMSGPEKELGGQSRTITILFTDIRGFTSLLERLQAREAVEMLNEYFTEIVDEVQAEEGTLDKFTGDGIIAFWNAPKSQPDHALRAVRTALKIQARLPALFARWRAENRSFMREITDLGTGIGINTGEAVIGNIGSPSRMEYTAIGDHVNITARLQGLAAAGEVLVTQATLDQVGTSVTSSARGKATLKGKSQLVPVFRVTGIVQGGS